MADPSTGFTVVSDYYDVPETRGISTTKKLTEAALNDLDLRDRTFLYIEERQLDVMKAV